MSELLPEGIYHAKVLDYGIRASAKGDAEPRVVLLVTRDGAVNKVGWRGSWNGGGLGITMEALLVMGLKSSSDLDKLSDGAASGVLDTEREVMVTIEHEKSEDGSKTFAKVKWVNASGAGKFKDAMEKKDYLVQVAGRNLKGELARIANERGYALEGGRVAASLDDLPF